MTYYRKIRGKSSKLKSISKIFHIVLFVGILVGCKPIMAPSIPIQTSENRLTPTVYEVQSANQENLSDRIVIRTENTIFIIDSNLNVIESFPNAFQYYFLDPKICKLTGLFLNQEIQMASINLSGQTINEERITILEPKINRAYQLTISPDHNWFAYKVIDGDFGMAFEYAKIQNVRLINKASPHQPFDLTTRGGALLTKIKWSPNSRYVATTDFDQNGIAQILLFDTVNEEKIQLSKFGEEMAGKLISTLEWSFDSSKLAFSIVSIENTSDIEYVYRFGEAGVITVAGGNLEWIPLEDEDMYVSQIWWGGNDQLLLSLREDSKSGTKFVLIYYDQKSGRIILQLKPEDLHSTDGFNFVFPLDQNLEGIGIVGNQTYIYNHTNNILTQIDLPFFKTKYDIITSPSGEALIQPCEN